MPELKLFAGVIVLVDQQDYDAVDRMVPRFKITPHTNGYAISSQSKPSYRWYKARKSFSLYLHRFIVERMLGHAIPEGKVVDHINGQKHDCRRCNLRLATHAQNLRNRQFSTPGVAGFLGVSSTLKGTFRAYYTDQNKQIHLGDYATAQEAAWVRDRAVAEKFGEFAVLNNVAPCEISRLNNREAGASGFVGVRPYKDKWMARVKRKGKEYHVGTYDTPEAASAARREWIAGH